LGPAALFESTGVPVNVSVVTDNGDFTYNWQWDHDVNIDADPLTGFSVADDRGNPYYADAATQIASDTIQLAVPDATGNTIIAWGIDPGATGIAAVAPNTLVIPAGGSIS